MSENLSGQKVKVAIADLIAKVEKAKAAHVREHEKAKAKFDADVADHQKRAVAALRRALADAEKGRLPGYDSEGAYRKGRYHATLTVEVPGGAPEDPGDLSTWRFDRDLGYLHAAQGDTLVIGLGDHWSEYLK